MEDRIIAELTRTVDAIRACNKEGDYASGNTLSDYLYHAKEFAERVTGKTVSITRKGVELIDTKKGA